MSRASLLSLPVEILYRILDHLDAHFILISLRSLCKRLQAVVDTYDRYELNVSTMSCSQIKLIFHIIQPEMISSLILSIGSNTDDIRGFCQLRFLTLIESNSYDINRYYPKPQLQEKNLVKSFALVLSAIANPKVRKLHLKNIDYMTEQISWPSQCALQHITLRNCTYTQYHTILRSLSQLQTFVMRDCTISDDEKALLNSYSQLVSLTIGDCNLSINDIEFLVSKTPSLIHFKLGSRRKVYDSTFSGSWWEQFFKTNLPNLTRFQFFFSYTLNNDDVITEVDSLIDSFQTPFWVNMKYCFVQCDYVMTRTMINLYTTPVNMNSTDSLFQSITATDSPAATIRWRISSTDVMCCPTLAWTNGILDYSETQVCS
ncbi:unnamed protein product [Rotaria sp. Silwood2]|nr:unnamed protein product [Rotaria sp. Silwood2]